MSFFAVLFVLLLEQRFPLHRGLLLHVAPKVWVDWVCQNFDAGKLLHGRIAWALAVLLPTLLTLCIYWLLWSMHSALAILWSFVVLYTTFGFRQFSHYFTDIQKALEKGNQTEARQLLAQWCPEKQTSQMSPHEMVAQVIASSVLAGHRHVFGVIAWFSALAALGLGPTGAVFYRMSEFVSRRQHGGGKVNPEEPSAAFQAASQAAWRMVDFLPVRLTALCFAIVGNFEATIENWRNCLDDFSKASASLSTNLNDAILVAATAGAIHIDLSGIILRRMPNAADQSVLYTAPELPSTGLDGAKNPRAAELGHLRSMFGLVWRSVVLWMLLLGLLTMARWVGWIDSISMPSVAAMAERLLSR